MSIEIIPHWIAPRRPAFICRAEDLAKFEKKWESANMLAYENIDFPPERITIIPKKTSGKRKHRSLWIKARAGK